MGNLVYRPWPWPHLPLQMYQTCTNLEKGYKGQLASALAHLVLSSPFGSCSGCVYYLHPAKIPGELDKAGIGTVCQSSPLNFSYQEDNVR